MTESACPADEVHKSRLGMVIYSNLLLLFTEDALARFGRIVLDHVCADNDSRRGSLCGFSPSSACRTPSANPALGVGSSRSPDEPMVRKVLAGSPIVIYYSHFVKINRSDREFSISRSAWSESKASQRFHALTLSSTRAATLPSPPQRTLCPNFSSFTAPMPLIAGQSRPEFVGAVRAISRSTES